MESRLLIKDVLLGDRMTNVLIAGNRFADLTAPRDAAADEVIEAEGMAILPPFYNTHTHAAMTLLRGYADDMPLDVWLRDYIWPREDKLTPDDIYEGSCLAIREMIKSGCVFFNDMYFEIGMTARAVDRMGVRACLGVTLMDAHPMALRSQKEAFLRDWKDPSGGRISLAVAPHAIYTAGPDTLRYAVDLARRAGVRLHIHLSETRQEVEDCLRDHGMRPVAYLDSLGLLGPDVIAAHCIWLEDDEIALMAKRGVTVAHCPCSNLKLGSGLFPYDRMIASGVRVTLGTDGCSSNNNLDMREEMKFAALLAKHQAGPSSLPASEALKWATVNGAAAFGIDAGEIAVGRLADAILVDLSSERFQPRYNLVSDWVYAADSSCVDTVICDGRILMRERELMAV